MLNGEAHRARRRLLMPLFGQQAMRGFVPTIQAIAARHLAQWAAAPGTLTVFPAMQDMVFEIAIALILGGEAVDRAWLNARFRVRVAGLFAVPLDFPGMPFGKAHQAGRELITYLTVLVEQRQALPTQPTDIPGSLITARDEHGRGLERAAIVDEILLLLFAGHDTTVVALSNLILLLGQHPDVYSRVRAEVDQAARPESLILEVLKTLPYLGQVIHEGLRSIPPIGGACRVTTQEVAYGGYRIPEGWTVVLSPRMTHRSLPWTEGDRFDPDRWSPERAEYKQPGAFIAFGGGARVCLGTHFALVEMSVVAALLLAGYQWELLPGQDLTFQMIPMPRPQSGIQVSFSRR